jgi:cardiolipin synthase
VTALLPRYFAALAGLMLLVALPRGIAETAPLSPQALSHGRLQPGGDDSGAASVKIQSFADTPVLIADLKATPEQQDVLTRHLEVEEAIAGQPLTAGNHVRLLENGPDTYQAMFAALRAAKRSIHFESYIFDSDDTGKQFASLLIKKKQQGLEVALMVDGVGTVGDSSQMFDQMRAAGIPVLVFHPLNPAKGSQPYSPDMRDHRKLLVIDDSIGFTGGVNISSVYSSAPSSRMIRHHEDKTDDSDHPSWRDTHVELTGPSVLELNRLFMANWKYSGGVALADATHDAAQLRPVSYAAGAVRMPNAIHDSEAASVSSTTKTDGPAEVEDAVVRIVAEAPARATGHEIYADYLAQLATAEHSIDITMAYFVPDPRLMGVLEAASRRGVDVRLILPSFSDSWVVIAAGRANYQPLLDAGVKIYERKGALLHAKTAVIDGVWSTVGSSNLDWRSFGLNDEVNAVIIGPKFGAQMTRMFEQDLNAAPVVQASKWKDRSLIERAKEHVALLVQRWL